MNWDGAFIVQLLVALGASGAIAQGVSAFRERRKTGAETGDILQSAAGKQVERLEREIIRARDDSIAEIKRVSDIHLSQIENHENRLTLMRQEMGERLAEFARLNEELVTTNEALHRKLKDQGIWSNEAYIQLKTQGSEVEPPPSWY